MKVKYERLGSRSNLKSRVITREDSEYGIHILKGWILKDETLHVSSLQTIRLIRSPECIHIDPPKREKVVIHTRTQRPLHELAVDPIYLFGYKPNTGIDQK